MHDLITGCYPPFPNIPAGPLNTPAGNLEIPAAFHEIRDTNGAVVEPFYTYGRVFMDVPTFSVPFLSLLIRCLADQPAHRPTLDELQAWVEAWEADPRNNEPDEFFQEVFGQPPHVRYRLGCLSLDLRYWRKAMLTYTSPSQR